ncbi:bifunctional 23S rRNA (guanine(2069)-N(7))-methyltransferase RlmK/23S rRNA (guanine(2445)-N(2))-methyltransferase RlmL [Congregibacter variabilis]|uniref:Ribosomal RNA large subunit methyltransferase K/L n=1 Tax=Congregibacter variabilis TaxID=3081200 RepID=A0ABZ0I470_9GAMM|nr:bifunctional 23S rRNA (guanine(2069)-N(7))-methyltransferase RlmK/23S rRNA (guanine(2445)-N(2))-methyltransferase RlmL [Congregibacter sp. IMCC43200]
MIADPVREWVATCPRALPPILAKELAALGATDIREEQAAVAFAGSRAVMYRACLWSRIATRVLLPIGGGSAVDADALYETLLAMPWPALIAEGSSFAVNFHGTNADIRNTRFGAYRSKDAIVDAFRAAGVAPPQVNPDSPDLQIVVRLQRDRVDVALDMVGESLHRRGYRRSAGDAPLKENLAAALLLRADWPSLAAEGGGLIDPMCGSATLLLEGAQMAADQAPALGREQFGFLAWQEHDAQQWGVIHNEARGRAERGLSAGLPEIRGYDADPAVIRSAQENIAAAGMAKWVRVSVKALGEVRKPTHVALPKGLVITNPPYGERIGRKDSLPQLYRHLGELLHREFPGWQAAILAGDREHGRSLGLRSHRQFQLFNGRLPVTLLLIDLEGNRLADGNPALATPVDVAAATDHKDLSPGAEMFANRVRKNLRKLGPWLKRSRNECYRLYDADIPEYAVAVDRYGDWLHVAEYKAPAEVSEEGAAQRLREIHQALPLASGVAAERIVFKQRERQRGKAQYQSSGGASDMLSVSEGDARLLVNLHDYLDTGLFLDHRPLRLRIAQEAKGLRFLNLYCYTGTATVHAALAGARETVSVDLSNSYLRWLSQNLAHNGLAEIHNHLERADVMQWLRGGEDLFDLILLDPPSFSNSRKVPGSFDVQRDHAGLIHMAMKRLTPAGDLYFSNNRRKFRLDEELAQSFVVEEITRATLDPDFARLPVPHQCWKLRHKAL